MERASRIELARRRSAGAKRALAVAAAVSFAAALVLARASDPGQAHGATASTDTSSTATTDDGFAFDQGSLAPSSTAQPDVQSSVS
jgi:ferric-dicitrate binding protein FerR (iron transport regulator)